MTEHESRNPQKTAELADEFKRGMRRMAASVCLITQGAGEERNGMVATAVTSVSVDPPSLLVCINKNASINETLSIGVKFAVNVLSNSHCELAGPFQSSNSRHLRFKTGTWENHALGVCYLQDSQCSLFCSVEKRIDHLTHTIIIGSVFDIYVSEKFDPLLYANGKYIQLAT